MPSAGLQWLAEQYPLGFCIIFSHGLELSEFMARMGGDPRRGIPMTRAQAEAVMLQGENGPVIRFSQHDGWVFGIESSGYHGGRTEVLDAVSNQTKALAITSTINADVSFKYAENQVMICTFDAILPHLRYGTDPDRFLTQMQQAGLDTDHNFAADPLKAVLDFTQATFDISVPQDIDERLLLTTRIV